MAAPVGNNHLSYINEPLIAHQDVTFDWEGALSIDHRIDLGLRSISLLARSIYVPADVIIRAKIIQLFVSDPEGEVNCSGNLQCEMFYTNARVHSVFNFQNMDGTPATTPRKEISGQVTIYVFSNP